ncbi:MAG: alpha/beta hydrolase [Mogibacterium sp.]|nr:alpha/beta hydrolase [Mogibacterium sp.]
MSEIKPEIAEFTAVMDFFLHPPRDDGEMLRAKGFEPVYRAVERASAGRFTTTVEPQGAAKGHIFLLHGGACILEAMKHGFVMRELADRGFRVSAFDYPLSPEAQYDEINAAVYQAYLDLKGNYPDDDLILFGDSAGATLCLELVFRLRAAGEPVPRQMVLPCPYVDWSVTDPDLDRSLPNDPGLPKASLMVAGKYFGGTADLKNPAVSPYFADAACFDGLGRIFMFYSTSDGLVPQFEKFAAKLTAAEGTELTVRIAEGLYHDYVLDVGLPEAQEALDWITDFCSEA